MYASDLILILSVGPSRANYAAFLKLTKGMQVPIRPWKKLVDFEVNRLSPYGENC